MADMVFRKTCHLTKSSVIQSHFGNIVRLVPFFTSCKQNDTITQSYKIVDNAKMKQSISNYKGHSLSFKSAIRLHQQKFSLQITFKDLTLATSSVAVSKISFKLFRKHPARILVKKQVSIGK